MSSRRALLLFGTVGLFLRSLTWLCLSCVLTDVSDDVATPNARGPEPAVLGAVQETAGAVATGGWQVVRDADPGRNSRV